MSEQLDLEAIRKRAEAAHQCPNCRGAGTLTFIGTLGKRTYTCGVCRGEGRLLWNAEQAERAIVDLLAEVERPREALAVFADEYQRRHQNAMRYVDHRQLVALCRAAYEALKGGA